jgi:HK97 family phage prohead protease
MDMLHKILYAESIKEANQATRRITAVISSEAVDRDDEIVSAAAMKQAMVGFMKNPVVLAAHTHRLSDGSSPVVGKVIKWWQEKDKTVAEIEFADTPLGLEYYVLYAGGYQKAFSIGFSSMQRSSKIIDGRSVSVHESIEMYELSAVAVPANPEALSKAMQDQITKSIAAMEKSVKDYHAALETKMNTILERLDDIADLQLNNPNGLGEALSGAPLHPAGSQKKNAGLFGRIAIEKKKEQ